MELQLIGGTFTFAKSEDLLTAIFKTKINFHQQMTNELKYSLKDFK